MEDYKKYTIETADKYPVSARVYGKLSINEPVLLIAGATGVPQRYYKRFALKMLSRGYTTVTFDFRGIAESKYGRLKDVEASFLDWAYKDIRSMIKWVNKEANPPLIIGHSFGGHAFGLLSESNQTRGLCTFGTGAGWHGWMSISERYKVLLMWKVLGPLLTPVYGYLPSKLVGIGENLPMQVYTQWKKWCSTANYWFDDDNYDFQSSFSAIKVPVTAVNSTDDQWAPPISANAFMKHYDQTDLQFVSVSPEQWAVDAIGHMGYFHSNCLAIVCDIVVEMWQKA